MENAVAKEPLRVVGRYALFDVIASGGMAAVHFGRLLGPVGFSRTVAIKRLHPHFAADPEFVSMFLDEARVAARIRHPNVVPTLDVVHTGGELFLVMEYIPGESLSRLARPLRDKGMSVPHRIVSAIVCGILHGLHAAHEARSEKGLPLGIVHRDISPQNVLVGTDGVPRVLDFGVAKAADRIQETKSGQIKGKLAYMSPEQLRGENVTRATDIYATSVVLWELLTGERLFQAPNDGALLTKVLAGNAPPPSSRSLMGPDSGKVPRSTWTALDALVAKGLSATMEARFATAREMALALEKIVPPTTSTELGDWVERTATEVLSQRAAIVADIESSLSVQHESVGALRVGLAAQAKQESSSGDSVSIKVRMSEPDIADSTVVDSSQLSRVSLVATVPPAPRRKAAIALGLGIGVVLAAVMAFALRAMKPKPTQATIPAIPTASAASGGDATGASGTTALPVPSAPASASAAPHGSAAAVEAKPDAGTSARPPSKPAVLKPPPPPPPGNDCNPPFVWGADGVKRYKPNCI